MGECAGHAEEEVYINKVREAEAAPTGGSTDPLRGNKT